MQDTEEAIVGQTPAAPNGSLCRFARKRLCFGHYRLRHPDIASAFQHEPRGKITLYRPPERHLSPIIRHQISRTFGRYPKTPILRLQFNSRPQMIMESIISWGATPTSNRFHRLSIPLFARGRGSGISQGRAFESQSRRRQFFRVSRCGQVDGPMQLIQRSQNPLSCLKCYFFCLFSFFDRSPKKVSPWWSSHPRAR